MLETTIQDVRYGAGQLRRNPGVTAVMVAILALAIGANTALFSVIDGVILAPLPYARPGQLAMILDDNLTLKHMVSVSYGDFRDWQREAKLFQQMAGVMFRGFDLSSPGPAEHLDGREISAGFFQTLGVRLERGREFTPAEDRHGGEPVAVVSRRLWEARFGGGAGERLVTLNGVTYRVVGVAPEGFRLFGEADVFVPLGQGDPRLLEDRSVHPGLVCVARMKDGVGIAQAQGEMSGIERRLEEAYPRDDRGLGAKVIALKDEITGEARGALLLLWGAVGLVLTIACANLASLLLARAAARRREFAIRAALGAGRGRLARQLVTESVLVSLAGGAVGLMVAHPALRAVLASSPAPLPRSENIGLNPVVLLFSIALTAAVGVLFGLAPAMEAMRAEPRESLGGGREAAGTHRRTQSALVAGQMAMTMLLVTGAGLLFVTVRNLWRVNPGFDPRHVVTFKVALAPATTQERMRFAYRALLSRLDAVPGVEAADVSSLVPFNQEDNSGPFWIGDNMPANFSEAPRALYHETGPDYPRVMKIPLIEGRFFRTGDGLSGEKVVVIDTVMARAYFAGRDPVGQRLGVAHWGTGRIVGVVGHARHWGLGRPGPFTRNQVYIPFEQIPDEWMPAFYPSMTVVARTRGEAAAIVPAIRAAVKETAGQTLYEVRTMRELMRGILAERQFALILFETFSGLALLLAAAGVYGVVSYSAARRVTEMGIRMALGAGRGEVFRLILGEGLKLAWVGLAIGTAAGLALARALKSFSGLLYGVAADDPVLFAAAAAGLTAVAALACYGPARRAAQADPMEALRRE